MKAISMKALQDLTLALPKCYIKPPDDANISWIVDRNKNKVAHIRWNTAEIYLHSEYKHVESVIDSIGRDRVTIIDRPEEHEIYK